MNYLSIFLKGFAMGAANVVPGVSGGTVAFITGIYERLIDALKSFDTEAVKLLFKGKIGELIKHVDAWFLAALGAGVIASVLTLAKLLKIGFEHYPVYVAALFFGLIAASVWSVAKMVKQWSPGVFVALVIGLAAAVSLVYCNQADESRALVYLLLCGVVAMCSMIIPGVSGSFVLLLMGNYQLIMIESINKLREGKFGEALPVLAPVGVGAVVGLVTLSHLLSWLFHKFHDIAVAVITGFVAGSLVIIWPWKSPDVVVIKKGKEKILSYTRELPEMNGETWIAIAIVIAGAVLMLGVEKLGANKDSAQ